MIIAPFDLETTGVDKNNDRVIEIGVNLYSTGHRRFFDSVGQLVKSTVPVSKKITSITGIQQEAVDGFGYTEENALTTILDFAEQAGIVLGHNIRSFDWPFVEKWAKRLGLSVPSVLLVDTFEDIPGVPPESLITMCAKAGFVFDAHSALADSQAAMRLAMYHNIDVVVERAKMPTVIVRSLAPRTATNSENKEAKFRWNPEFRIWWKAVKELDIQELANSLPFKISVLDKTITLEQLRDN